MNLVQISNDTTMELQINAGNTIHTLVLSKFDAQPYTGIILVNPIYQNGKILGLKSSPAFTCTLHFASEHEAWEAENIDICPILYQGQPCYRIKNVEAKRLNRREAYRIFIGHDMDIKVSATDITPTKVEVRDISETGFAFYSKDKDIPVGTKLTLRFSYLKVSETFNAIVVRRIDENNRTLYGCKFIAAPANMGQIMLKVQREKRNSRTH